MVGSAQSFTAPRLTQGQGRPVTDDDIGLKVLREAPAEETQIIEYVFSDCLFSSTHFHDIH